MAASSQNSSVSVNLGPNKPEAFSRTVALSYGQYFRIWPYEVEQYSVLIQVSTVKNVTDANCRAFASILITWTTAIWWNGSSESKRNRTALG